MRGVVGWDIGGVNTKVARAAGGALLGTGSVPLQIQHDFEQLPFVLRQLARDIGTQADDRHALTFTAELSQRFRTKAEGVHAILDAIESALPDADISVLATDARWLTPREARNATLLVSASNWMATALLVAQKHADALLIDVGTTTTDIIPIVSGKVQAQGRTDLDRLVARELVYTGAVRTPLEALVSALPVSGDVVMPAAEGFALTGDVHVWLGSLAAAAYTAPTPDGRPATREFAGERLLRAVCADRSMLSDDAIDAIARAAAEAQLRQVHSAIVQVRDRWPQLRNAVVAGLGDFIAERAARLAGLDIVRLRDTWADASTVAPAAAAALLLHQAS